jgi:pimeloyl-ACP methyl ester carboxylesterase
MQPTKRWDFDGIAIAIYEKGPRYADLAIIFVHGNSSSARAFERQYSDLDEFHLLSFDLPGHGQSDNAGSSMFYSLPLYSELLRRLVESIRVEKLLLVGWSLGGHIVLQTLDQLNNECQGIVIGTPPLRSVADIPHAFIQSSVFEVIQKGEVSQADADLWGRNCSYLGANYPKWLKADFLRTEPRARTDLIKNLVEGKSKNEWDQIARSSQPITLIVGADDKFIRKDFLEDPELVRNISGEQTLILSEAGHIAHWDAPESFNKILRNRIDHQ